jgi:hypothetical protein
MQVVLDNYVPNTLWDLQTVTNKTAAPVDRFQYYYTDYTIDQTIYEFTLKRRPLYFMMNSIFPCLVLNVITVLSFALPFIPQISLSKKFSCFNIQIILIYLNNRFIQSHDHFFDIQHFFVKHIEFDTNAIRVSTSSHCLLSSLDRVRAFAWIGNETLGETLDDPKFSSQSFKV